MKKKLTRLDKIEWLIDHEIIVLERMLEDEVHKKYYEWISKTATQLNTLYRIKDYMDHEYRIDHMIYSELEKMENKK